MQLKILLVDDEGELISTMAERLEYRDVEAHFALSGAEALEKMQSHAYHAVVIDLKMPGMSGVELIRAIQHKYPHIPIFLMTGHGFSLDGEELPDGIIDYLPKPVKIDELVDKIRQAVKNDL